MQIFDLKRFRKDKNLTQVELAGMFNCNQNFISRIESGIRSLPRDKMDVLESKYGDISDYCEEREDGISIPDATPQDLLYAGADAFSRQLIQMMNEKLIAPYSLLEEKDKEIEKLNKKIWKLEAELENRNK